MRKPNLINTIHRFFKEIATLFNSKTSQLIKPETLKRRRGTAIVETSQGIILVSGRKEEFLLPGGGAERYESRRNAAIRELEEETGLKADSATYLFTHIGGTYQYKNKYYKNAHKVFLITANGTPEPRNEINQIKYYNPSQQTKLSQSTSTILEKYFNKKT